MEIIVDVWNGSGAMRRVWAKGVYIVIDTRPGIGHIRIDSNKPIPKLTGEGGLLLNPELTHGYNFLIFGPDGSSSVWSSQIEEVKPSDDWELCQIPSGQEVDDPGLHDRF